MRNINLIFKRIIDILASLIGLVILSPLFIIISVAIKTTSKGPIFFKQSRLGRNGESFKIIKFRTMIVNAEKIGDGLTVKSENDDRITKVGKFLRSTSLDELPQFFNILLGQMSLVGPRPPVTYYPYEGYENYPKWAKKRFQMRPGVTGLAQVTVRNSVSWDERIKLDNQYIDKFNLWIDITILFKTLFKMFKKEDVYGEDKRNPKKSV